MSYINETINNITSLNRYSKRLIAIITDLGLCAICVWLAFILRLEDLNLLKYYNTTSPTLLSVILALPVFWLCGLYRTIFRFTGLSIVFTVSICTFVYGLLFFSVIVVYNVEGVPRSIGVIQPMLLFFTIMSSRLLVKYFLTGHYRVLDKSLKKEKVLIYGAGDAGRQLALALENNLELNVVGFLDDNSQLHKQLLLGKTIFSPLKLNNLINSKDVSLVLLALPLIGRNRRNQIIEELKKFKIKVKTLPSVQDILTDKITISDIKDLNIEDLLNRDQIAPNHKLLYKDIESNTVLVTGAGGSIGSELCRQIIKLKPNKLLLLELNEFALYKIYEELIALNKNLRIIPLINNVQDEKNLNKIFETFSVDTIYHTAAYKHVPLVEENICEGVKNNVFGTLAIAKAAIKQKVSSLVLISSDKAVRPTNIMGASKRLAELCMQGLYDNNKNIFTKFSIVRFGNVLESSGSVIPKFKEQIKKGGPVTLTHPDVTRYFMTIIEAAQLVIQAGSMGKDCEVFVLDMGQSVKIKDLIYRMITLSGLQVKNDKNLDGDIEIKITGLRPGEKLYEELLIGNNPQKTSHKKIQKIQDPIIPFEKLDKELNHLKNLIDKNNANEVKIKLDKLLNLYNSNSKIVDHIYNEINNIKYKEKKFLLNEYQNKIVN